MFPVVPSEIVWGFLLFLFLVAILVDLVYRVYMYSRARWKDTQTGKPREQSEGFQADTKLTNKGWKGYRVGDVYRMGYDFPFFGLGIEQMKGTANFHMTYFPDTIAGSYLRCIGLYDKKNKKCASKVIREKCLSKTRKDYEREIELKGKGVDVDDILDESGEYLPNTAAIHLRIGDTLNAKSANLVTGLGPEKYKEVCRKLSNEGVTKALLIGGIHKPKTGSGTVVDEKDSFDYAEKVVEYCKEAGVKTTMVSNDPDSDLCLFSKAKVFVSQPKSGYSQFAQGVVRHRKGKVIPATLEEFLRADGDTETEHHHGFGVVFSSLYLCVALILFVVSLFRKPRPSMFPQWRGVSTIMFLLGIISIFVIPMILPRSDRDYSNFYGSKVCRRIQDSDLAWFINSVLFFVVSGCFWASTLPERNYIVYAIIFLIASAYTLLKISFHWMGHTEVALILILTIMALIFYVSPFPKKSVAIWMAVIFLPYISVSVFDFLWWGKSRNEKFHVPEWYWQLSYWSHFILIIGLMAWIIGVGAVTSDVRPIELVKASIKKEEAFKLKSIKEKRN